MRVFFNNKTVKNASWIIGCRILQAICALLINMFTARYLGPSNFGLINYAASLVAFLSPLMTLGISSILVNEIVTHPDQEGEVVGTSMLLCIVSSIFCIVGLGAFVMVAHPGEKDTLIVCFLYSLLLISKGIELIQYWFQAKLWSKYVSVSMLIVYLVVAAYKVFLLLTGKSIYWFSLSYAIEYFLIAIALLVVYKNKKGPQLKFSFNVAKRLIGRGKHFIIADIMGVVLAQSDKIMLKSMIGNAEVGFYAAAWSIANITNFVFAAIIDSMRPVIFNLKRTDEALYKEKVSKLFGIVIYLSLAQSIFIACLAKLIVYIMYGKAYSDVTPILQIVIWYTSFSYIGAVRGVWLLAEEKQKYLWQISLIGMIANIVLNFVFIPWLGAIGAAIATLITQILANVVFNFLVKPMREVNLLILKGMDIRKLIK